MKTIRQEKVHFLDRSITTREVIFIMALAVCLTPWISPPVALMMGVVIAQFIGHPFLHLNHRATHVLLQVSVIGLGFGMNVHSAVKAGREGMLFTVVSITATLGIGYILGRVLKIERKTAHLISCGTAICGGSAIAAISPAIKAEEKQISVALGTVFILNSVALFFFPFVGHLLHLTQTQFGLWSAIAIHDTSSVTGAAARYGNEALEVATTVKLARALWIIPVVLGTAFIFKGKQKIRVPWFIILFILAMVIHTYFPVEGFSKVVVSISHTGLTVTLFLIGAGLSGEVLRGIGARPLVLGILLWVGISILSLFCILCCL